MNQKNKKDKMDKINGKEKTTLIIPKIGFTIKTFIL